MSIAVITPTYNERDSLGSLIEQIFSLTISNITLVVVDDCSPDGTGEIAEKLAEIYPIRVIHREKKMGLGTAYVHAFREILTTQNKNKPDYIIQMDADLSHDPAAIPKFLEAIGHSDVVLGSRYVPRGKIENWDFFRRLISRLGNFYARRVLSLPYRDLTSGYKCFRREVLESMNLDSLSSVGYNFQIETTFHAHKKNFRIQEIPIIFRERKTGQSKFHISIILESFLKVLLLRFHA